MPSAITSPTPVDFAEFAWLASAEASRWLAELASSELPLHTLTAKLRREFTSSRSHLLLEQSELRRRGTEKFSRAARMLFTRRLLEQATDEWISRYKAEQFRNQRHVGDLCCGIGGDLLGLASVGGTTGVDRSEVATFCADHNAAVYRDPGDPPCYLETADVNAIDVSEFSAWHLDPNRRPKGRRTTRVELHEPSLDAVERMLSRQGSAAIKLAPASDLPEHTRWSAETEFEWISRGSECRQLVAWRGELARNTGQRRATSVSPTSTASFIGLPDLPVPIADQVQGYVLEPDAAILAAHLTGALGNKHNSRAITAGVAYLTGPDLPAEPLLTAFEVLDSMPLDRRKLAAYLRQREVGRVEIKHRGLTLDPDRLRSELKLRGDQESVLIVTKIAGRATVLFTRRVAAEV